MLPKSHIQKKIYFMLITSYFIQILFQTTPRERGSLNRYDPNLRHKSFKTVIPLAWERRMRTILKAGIKRRNRNMSNRKRNMNRERNSTKRDRWKEVAGSSSSQTLDNIVCVHPRAINRPNKGRSSGSWLL